MVFHGNTMVLHGKTTVQFVSHGSFHGFRYGVFMEYMERHSILREYRGVPWSLYGPMVFHRSFHGLTCAICMKCMEFHGTRHHTTATMAFHGGIHGFTYGISMKYMEFHSISWEYHGAPWKNHGPVCIPWKFSWVWIWSFHGVYEIRWYFTEIPWHSMETALGFHRNPIGDFRTGYKNISVISVSGDIQPVA